MNNLEKLMQAREEAERRLLEARRDLGEAERQTRKHALERFEAALAERGIAPGGNIVIEGIYSGAFGAGVRDMKHDATPVHFRSASVDSLKAVVPHENCTDKWWWFRVQIARLKKNGKPRDEWRNFVVRGDTPEDAAAKIQPDQREPSR